MLSEDIIKQTPVLTGLTPEQMTAVIALHKNDLTTEVNTAIATKIGEVAGRVEADVLASTGIAKNEGEKYYDYLKRAGTTLKAKAGDGTELATLKADLEAAKTALKNNTGDAALKADLEAAKKAVDDEKARVKALQDASTATATEWQTKLTKAEERYQSLQIDHEFDQQMAGLKFKDEAIIPAQVRSVMIQSAKQKIVAENKPDFIDDGKGGKRLVFRDSTGQVKNNPENALNPYTAGELLAKELAPILEAGAKGAGAGSKGGNGGGGGNVPTASIGSATTQPEAVEAIRAELIGNGLATSSKEYQAAFDKAWKDNEVAKLPLFKR